MTTPVIAVSDLHYTYPGATHPAVRDMAFTVGGGEIFGFLGPSGAGKTTTQQILIGLIAGWRGAVRLFGAEPASWGPSLYDRIGVSFEMPVGYASLTVSEDLAHFALLHGTAPRACDELLDAVGLRDTADRAVGALSKGMRVRLNLARALLHRPELLFLDEPTAGLDPAAARDVHELIAELRQRGVTIFLTTHRLEEAERLCDRVAILNRTLRTIGRPEELRERLFARTLTARTLVPLSDPGGVFAGLAAVDGWHEDGPATYVLVVSELAVAAPAVTRALVAAGADVLSINESQRSLEDVYFELIEQDEEAGRR
jgi:ABC-2 type transport system ATP-binding protein